MAVFAALGVALVPVALNALALLRQAGLHVIVDQPTPRNLMMAVKLGFVFTCGAAAFLLRSLIDLKRPDPSALPLQRRLVSPASLVLIGGWWLCQPLSLFLFSWLTGNSVFLGRYVSLALPGSVLAAAAVAAPFVSRVQWKPVALAFGLGLLLLLGAWKDPWPRHDISNWRLAVLTANRLHLDPATPIIVPSPFIEARLPVWRPDYPLGSFLYSHLQVYRPQGRIYPFPYETSTEAERFAAQLSRQTLLPSGRFLIYGSAQACRYWLRWFAVRPELAGWNWRRLGPFGDVEVVVFENPGTRTLLASH